MPKLLAGSKPAVSSWPYLLLRPSFEGWAWPSWVRPCDDSLREAAAFVCDLKRRTHPIDAFVGKGRRSPSSPRDQGGGRRITHVEKRGTGSQW